MKADAGLRGLASGAAYAVGELALGAALVVGFALHNTSEGLTIVAPLTGGRRRLPLVAGLSLIAAAPAILGAVIGTGISNPTLSAVLFGVGGGAIDRVVVQMLPATRHAGLLLVARVRASDLTLPVRLRVTENDEPEDGAHGGARQDSRASTYPARTRNRLPARRAYGCQPNEAVCRRQLPPSRATDSGHGPQRRPNGTVPRA